ncbi:cyclophilin-like protein [Hanseniaspora valbyensis NRRL Y-1626]|uniref:Cyclophilin-like protein n=1 Tax=Hanseniaspora valbyensis NRRL Y-1626 TaxID=766949 RepID=A0A1B7TAD6_9ASCO|nr:cyclophilin-like protein [Hanseniaspora valbyensis NRRL Y-1626]
MSVQTVLLNIILLFSTLCLSSPVALKDSHKAQTYEINPPTTALSWFVIEYFDPDTLSYKEFDVTIELFGSIAPKTVNNFQQLTNGVKALMPNAASKDEAVTLSYTNTLGTVFDENRYVQFGDIIPEIGPFSIYGYKFDDETFQLTFDRPGRVAMANYGPDTNGCQFFITTDPLPELDNSYVAFGQVVDGLDTIIEKLQHLNNVELPEELTYKAKIKFGTSTGLHHDNIEAAKKSYLEEVALYRSGVATETNSLVFDPMTRSKLYEEHMDLIKGSDKKVSNSDIKKVESSQSSKVSGVYSSSNNPVEVLAVLICKLLLIISIGVCMNYVYSKYKHRILSKLGSGSGSGNDYKVVGLRHD